MINAHSVKIILINFPTFYLMKGRFSHIKGTITRGATSLDYVHMVLLPVLSSMFDHLGRNYFGPDLIGKVFSY
jgi:hypothetical protein